MHKNCALVKDQGSSPGDKVQEEQALTVLHFLKTEGQGLSVQHELPYGDPMFRGEMLIQSAV